ncbi:MAG: hypothetical protein ACW981_02520 [Candidatus Hodarchaeales archaeon]|jgi:hypothetical protein
MNNSIIEGLVLTVFTDEGPDSLHNLTSLDELIAQKLGIVGITILSMGFVTAERSSERNYKLLGPIPVPDLNDYSALSIFFNVIADMGTIDTRVKEYGRTCNLFLIFKVKYRNLIFNAFENIERISNNFLSKFKKESELQDINEFRKLLNDLKTIKISQEVEIKPKITEMPKFSPENINYGFYTVNQQEQLTPVHDLSKIHDLSCLILVSLNEKTIFVIKVETSLPQREMFIAGRAASKLNLEKLKSEFQIKNISDEVEVNYHMNKTQNILKQFM